MQQAASKFANLDARFRRASKFNFITPAFADKSEGAWGLGAGLVVGFLGVVGR